MKVRPPPASEDGANARWCESPERSKIAVDVDIAGGIERLGSDMEIAIFRVVQECLTNVHRHSGSHSACVRLAQGHRQIRLEVKDAGKGISPEKQLALSSSGQLGVGFRGMRERIRQLDGDLDIQSDATGTTITATLPLAKPSTTSAQQVA
jgi:signal transduction histidine kinase